MAPVRTIRNILMELRKVCQHPYLHNRELENEDGSEEEIQKQLTEGSGKLAFLKLLLPKLKERGHRVLLFSQFKIALDMIEDFLVGEGYKFLRLDGDVQQAQRQKSMDAFNAPNSEYFVFLLTTRAGGVGINLATADTVIVYDPDFNPHMDLQAIARSHRYGQKKRVMVFKLMTKNSVEEQIILNGKKKMVLDHLVVQQMGKDNEEGEIDNMLLHGAAALYEKTNDDGTSSSDIRYTSEDVEKLIDKVQADAEAEAKALEDRDQAVADGGTPAEGAKPKESMDFGFAKVWETDKKDLQEMTDGTGNQDDDDSEALAIIAENVRKAREAELAAPDGKRARRTAAARIRYRLDAGMSDENPTPKKGKGKGKGKRKASEMDSSDAEFALKSGGESSESESSDIGILTNEDLVDGNGNLVPGLLHHHQALQKQIQKQQQRSQAAAAAVAQAANSAAVPAITATVPAPSSALIINGLPTISVTHNAGVMTPAAVHAPARESEQERLARKAQRRRDKAKLKEAKELQRQTQPFSTGSVNHPAPSRLPLTQVNSNRSTPGPALVNQASIEAARVIVQHLYHCMSQFKMGPEDVRMWASMTLPELDPAHRVEFYDSLARKVDGAMIQKGHSHYFTEPARRDPVARALLDGQNLMTDMGHIDPASILPDDFAKSFNLPAVSRQSDRPLPRKPLIHLSAALPTSNGIAMPAQAGPSTHRNGSSSSVSRCTFCKKDGHDLSSCLTVPEIDELIKLRPAIYNGPESDSIKMKAKSAQEIDHILHLYAVAGDSTAKSFLRDLSAMDAGDVSSLVNGATAIDGDTANFHPKNGMHISKKPRVESDRCRICDRSSKHSSADCPVVRAGRASIAEAISKFDTSDPMRATLRKHYESASAEYVDPDPCAFCTRFCGRDIKMCAINMTGNVALGRKNLKRRIREIEVYRENPDCQGRLRELTDVKFKKLFEVYQAWPREA